MNTSSKLIPLVAGTSLEVLEGGVQRVRGVLTRAVVVVLVDIRMHGPLLLMTFREGGVVRTNLRLNGSFVCLANLRTEFDMLELDISKSGCVSSAVRKTTHSADEDVVALNRRQGTTLDIKIR